MRITKYLGIMMAAIACIALGFSFSTDIRKRIRQLRSFHCALGMLKGEVEYAVSSLSEAFFSIADKLEDPFSTFFREMGNRLEERENEELFVLWEEEIKKIAKWSCLRESDWDIVRQLGRQLGYLDVNMQLRTLDILSIQVDELIHNLAKEAKISCKMYQYLGILGALSVVLVCI